MPRSNKSPLEAMIGFELDIIGHQEHTYTVRAIYKRGIYLSIFVLELLHRQGFLYGYYFTTAWLSIGGAFDLVSYDRYDLS